MNLKFKKLTETASSPVRHYATDSGFDISSDESILLPARSVVKVKTGLAFDIPISYELQVRPRSGLSSKGVIAIFGTVDQGYRDQVYVTLFNAGLKGYQVRTGDRIAQIVMQRIEPAALEEVSELSEADRGKNGHGSTGR